MKLRVFALILALSFVVWAQESPAPSAPNSTPVPEAKSCGHHMDGMKSAGACCQHAKSDGKDAMACCGKDMDKCQMKDAKSCCEGKGKSNAMKACMKQCKKGKKTCETASSEKDAGKCCGKGRSQHQHAHAGS